MWWKGGLYSWNGDLDEAVFSINGKVCSLDGIVGYVMER